VLDDAIAEITAADLAVIVDIHSISLSASNAANYSGALDSDDALVANFLAFWRTFAAHLAATTDPEWVFIEPMNEPVFESNPARWTAIQRDLLAAIREQAPDHTLLATSTNWSSLDTFVELEPLDDPNIVYNFHFYEPFLFTHQGATWSWWVVGPPLMPGSLFAFMLPLGSLMFQLAVKLVAPIILVLFITQVAMGLVARTVPQVQVMILAFPVTILLGLIFLSLTLFLIGPFLVGKFAWFKGPLFQVLRAWHG
jgi:hypothetical protein